MRPRTSHIQTAHAPRAHTPTHLQLLLLLLRGVDLRLQLLARLLLRGQGRRRLAQLLLQLVVLRLQRGVQLQVHRLVLVCELRGNALVAVAALLRLLQLLAQLLQVCLELTVGVEGVCCVCGGRKRGACNRVRTVPRANLI
jgi:hypothetical protein